MPVVPGAVDLLSSATWTLLLFGLSSAGFGLFLGRILFSAPVVPPRAKSSLDLHPPSCESTSILDLRSSPRIPVAHTKILVSRDTPLAEPIEAWVTDQSLGGLGLSVLQPMELGSVLRLNSEQVPEWASSLYLEVRYCRLHRGRWRLGCQFVDG